jgi:hypothetical protein
MIEILEFIFRDFWTWLGTIFILSVVCGSLFGLIRVNINRAPKKDKEAER